MQLDAAAQPPAEDTPATDAVAGTVFAADSSTTAPVQTPPPAPASAAPPTDEKSAADLDLGQPAPPTEQTTAPEPVIVDGARADAPSASQPQDIATDEPKPRRDDTDSQQPTMTSTQEAQATAGAADSSEVEPAPATIATSSAAADNAEEASGTSPPTADSTALAPAVATEAVTSEATAQGARNEPVLPPAASTSAPSPTQHHTSPRPAESGPDAEPSSPRPNHSDSSRHTTPATSTGETEEKGSDSKDAEIRASAGPETPKPERSQATPTSTSQPEAAEAEATTLAQDAKDIPPTTPAEPPQEAAAAASPSQEAPAVSAEDPAVTTPPATEAKPMQPIAPAYFYPIDSSSSTDPRTNLSQDGVPVFEPTMEQFQDFYAFCQAIDDWGMRSGIVKIVPPKEWSDALPSLRPSAEEKAKAEERGEELADVAAVRIKNAILQHFSPAGSGVWRQTNVTRTVKVWNAKQWADTCISQGQKGPEMQRMKWKVDVEGAANDAWINRKPKDGEKDPHASIMEEDGVRTRSGKARPSLGSATPTDARAGTKRKRPAGRSPAGTAEAEKPDAVSGVDAPVSSADAVAGSQQDIEEGVQTPKRERTADIDEEMPALEGATTSPGKFNLRKRPSRTGLNQQHQLDSVQASPNASETSASPVKAKKVAWAETTTAEEWDAFDHVKCWLQEGLSEEQLEQLRLAREKLARGEEVDVSELPTPPEPAAWDVATCREIESEYWRNLNFGKPPMYGADLKGTLFDDRTQHWNVGKLDNLLTRLRLRRKLPGVTTPYLYWGMWRATFAWHVEDMDLYSINYIHFGAPKQWYSIRQADRQRFESAMAAAFPSDSRRCPHFMRHKSYLASPSFLASHGIRPLRLVHNAGEFVITYPYGYHSGFNLGYNCAESVNFALDSWLDIGRRANYCHCDQAQQSVRMDVDALLEESRELEEADRRKELRKARDETLKAAEEEELEKRRKRNEKAREARKVKKEKDAAAAAAAATSADATPGGPRGAEELDLAASLAMMASGSSSVAGTPQRVTKGEAASENPCVFCPSQIRDDLVRIPDNVEGGGAKAKQLVGKFAHRLCASFIPETWVGRSDDGKYDIACGVEGIEKARYSLKCQICPTPALQKMGAKIQCTRGRCPKSVHVSCALIEEHGWFIDVCTAEVADRLEVKDGGGNGGNKAAKKKKAKVASFDDAEDEFDAATADQGGSAAPAGEADSATAAHGEERLVVLCRSHNPLFKQAEEARKLEELRDRILDLPVPSVIKIKSSGGVFEATMTEVKDLPDGQGEVIIDDQGRPRSVKFSRIIFDTPAPAPEPAPKPEPAQAAAIAAEPVNEGGKSPAKARKRTASAKAAAAAADASAQSAETNGAADEPRAKRARKASKKAEAAAANNATVDELVARSRPTPVRRARVSLAKKADEAASEAATPGKATPTKAGAAKATGAKATPGMAAGVAAAIGKDSPAKAASTKPTPKRSRKPANAAAAPPSAAPMDSVALNGPPQGPPANDAALALQPPQSATPTAMAATQQQMPDYAAARGARQAYHLAHPGAPVASAHQSASSFPQFGQRYGGVYGGQQPTVLQDSRSSSASTTPTGTEYAQSGHAHSTPAAHGYRAPAAPSHDWQHYEQAQQQQQYAHAHAHPQYHQQQQQQQHLAHQQRYAHFPPGTMPQHYRQSPHRTPAAQSSPLAPPPTSRASSHSDSAMSAPVAARAAGHDLGHASFEQSPEQAYSASRAYAGVATPSYGHAAAAHAGNNLRPEAAQYSDLSSYPYTHHQERRMLPSYREPLVPLSGIAGYSQGREMHQQQQPAVLSQHQPVQHQTYSQDAYQQPVAAASDASRSRVALQSAYATTAPSSTASRAQQPMSSRTYLAANGQPYEMPTSTYANDVGVQQQQQQQQQQATPSYRTQFAHGAHQYTSVSPVYADSGSAPRQSAQQPPQQQYQAAYYDQAASQQQTYAQPTSATYHAYAHRGSYPQQTYAQTGSAAPSSADHGVAAQAGSASRPTQQQQQQQQQQQPAYASANAAANVYHSQAVEGGYLQRQSVQAAKPR